MKELLDIFLKLITDFRIILIFLAVILYLNFVMYISTYRKKSGGSRNKAKGRSRSPAASAVADMDSEVTGDIGEIPDPD